MDKTETKCNLGLDPFKGIVLGRMVLHTEQGKVRSHCLSFFSIILCSWEF